ncbi:MAG: hypothetical protein IT377_00520 [Polyangiaceae bacterium]|nr:hypothetical protein [Polyangiaceae bacterium]
MTDDPVDLSALDPARDPANWEARIAAVTTRALAARRRKVSVESQLALWARPSLAVAASLALITWAGVWAFGGRAPAAPRSGDPAIELARWASTGELPATPQLMKLLGDSHGRD